jgi:GNAT superfamily N-acetyltransferase
MDPATMPIQQVRRLVWPLANIDPENAVALLAIHDGQAVAVARMHRIPASTDAESAIVVRDDFQQDGLGTHLLIWLRECALEMGITHLIALVQAQNHPILKVIQRSGLECQWRFEQGETYLAVDIRGTPNVEGD